jgi:hypothetical protein
MEYAHSIRIGPRKSWPLRLSPSLPQDSRPMAASLRLGVSAKSQIGQARFLQGRCALSGLDAPASIRLPESTTARSTSARGIRTESGNVNRPMYPLEIRHKSERSGKGEFVGLNNARRNGGNSEEDDIQGHPRDSGMMCGAIGLGEVRVRGGR